MNYLVELTSQAEEDIFEIYKFIAYNDSIENAEAIFDRIVSKCFSLSEFPFRGRINPELAMLNKKDYYEIQCKPYRIIYRVVNKTVYVHYVLDGRRDVKSLMEEKLLR